MDSITSMKSKLESVGIYDLSENSNVYKELAVYCAALDALIDIIKETERESTVKTAETYGLKMWEDILGERRESMDAEIRRELLQKRLSISEADFTRQGAEKLLSSLGVAFTLYEYPAMNYMHIQCEGAYSKAQRTFITEQAIKQLPAHLDIFLDFRSFCFEDMDNASLTFSSLDAKNLTWQQIENYGLT